MHATIARLRDVLNAHDADAMVTLFADDYRSEQPAHPNRGFGGSGQVHANWSQMFAGIPDLRAEVRADTDDGATSWSEWEWLGHHTDGSLFHERGVVILGLRDDGAIAWARLYMEPVEQDGAAIEETVRQLAKVPR
jgi:ketosteroid isomerase-like protein